MQMNQDYRQHMGCQDCWAFKRDESLHVFCRIAYDILDRPGDLPSDVTRNRLSPVFDHEILMKWPCEYRYSKKEMMFIRSGKFKEAHVTKAVADKLNSLDIPDHRLE